jgi:hypothetical protein
VRRLLALTVVVLSVPSCSQLLGISDPTPADGGPGGDGGDIDAPPPACVTAAAFRAEATFAAGGAGTAMVVAQLDRRPGLDVAVAVGDGIQILSGDGAGSFTPGLKITTATPADGLASEDFDADADDDLIVWDAGGTAIAAIRQNSTVTPSTFLAEQPLTNGTFTGLQVAVPGQLDGNLVTDLLIKDGVEARPYTSNLGTPGTFGKGANAVPGIGAGDTLVLLKQLDDQQREDAVFIGANGDVKLSLQTTQFGTPAVIASGARNQCVGFGTFDEGTSVDMIVGTAAGGVIYRGSGGTFTMVAGSIPAITGPTMQVIDLNGDGKDDLVLATRIVYQCAPARPGEPGVFTQVEDIGSGGVVLAADVTADGKPDLLRLVGTELKVRVQP